MWFIWKNIFNISVLKYLLCKEYTNIHNQIIISFYFFCRRLLLRLLLSLLFNLLIRCLFNVFHYIWVILFRCNLATFHNRFILSRFWFSSIHPIFHWFSRFLFSLHFILFIKFSFLYWNITFCLEIDIIKKY